ncbi:EamA family transporter [Thalassotalea sp. M1531]|uniref:EamA family transporter n=1 Tax=Thalassotalea algicola TaxID=2716224 RepID=A0A7Y0Q5R3_9GAMM|nr:EamA family transporter [Thalassotalea algicola]NMP30381.1 EamA family transporter [Thalassotalea algicola]
MATLFGIIALLFWSSLALLAAKTGSLPPFLILALCFSVSFIISVVWRYKHYGRWFSRPKLRRSQWLLGIYGLFGYHFCYFFALRFAPVLEANLINYLWPLLLTLFLAHKGERVFALLGGVIAFSGIAVLLSTEQASFSSQHIVGYILALGAAFIWSSYSALLTKQKSDLGDIGWISLAVAALSMSCHFLFEPRVTSISLIEWGYILLIGLGPLGGSFYLWEHGLAKGNNRLLASLSFFTPVFSSMLLALFGLAHWSVEMFVALVMILLGGLVTHSKNAWQKMLLKADTKKNQAN